MSTKKSLYGILSIIVVAIVTTAIFKSTGNTPKEDIYLLKLAHDQTSDHPYDLGAKQFAEALESKTNGKIKIKIYPNSQLGDTPEQIEQLKMGSLDISIAAFSHVSQFVPEFRLFGAPYLFESREQFANVFDGEVGKLLDEISLKRYGIRLLSTFSSGDRILFNRKHPVLKSDDLSDLKIRVMLGEADSKTWKAFGAIPTPMPYSELYSALQAGVIDGAENEPVSILRNRFYETCSYFSITNHLVLPMGIFISDKTLQKLPEEYRSLIFEEAKNAAIWERDYIAKMNSDALEEMVSKYGVKENQVDKASFMEKGKPIQDELAQEFDVTDLLEKIRAAK